MGLLKYVFVIIAFCAILFIGMSIADRSTETLLNGDFSPMQEEAAP